MAVPAACLVLALGLVAPGRAGATLQEFWPTLAFLAAVLVLAALADAQGVFAWLGALIGRGSRSRPVRLLTLVFVTATATTAVLSLDATVLLLTPAVIATIRRVGVRPDPPLYATAHLSNTASLLLPVSNLTNLLAFGATGLSFIHFAGLMALPFLACVAVEYLVFRVFFAADLRGAGGAGGDRGRTGARSFRRGDHRGGGTGANQRGAGVQAGIADVATSLAAPRTALAILGAVLAAFLLAPLADIPAYQVAVAGALVMAMPAMVHRRITPTRLIAAASPLFILFVAALLIVVDAAVGNGPAAWLAAHLPTDASLPSLLTLAGFGALLAATINNLPAVLVLLAALGPHPAAGPLLAMLIGVNIGPNLTYTGSLAVLLWRRVLHRHGYRTAIGRFTTLGLITVPLCLTAGTTSLWLMLQA